LSVLDRDIIHDDTGIRVFDVTGDERPITLLPSGIPELQPNGFIVDLQSLREEIYSDRWLNKLDGTAGVSL